jgi:hypothetical protein
MKKLLFLLLVASSISVLAEKKKSKSTAKKNTQVTTTVTEDGTVVEKQVSPSSTSEAKRPELEAMQVGAPLFTFSTNNYKGEKISNENIIDGNNVIVVLFNPDCGHCKDVGRQLTSSLESMPNTQIFFFTGENMVSEINDYVNLMELNKNYTEFQFAGISKDLTDQIFEYKGIPQIMVYNKEKLLQRVFYQEIKLEEIIELLNK